MNIDRVLHDIHERREHSPQFLVAIDGFGGAGKSTLADRLAAALENATVVAMDDFILKDHMEDDSWELGWDRSRLLDQVISPYIRGEQVTYQKLDWVSNTLSEPVVLGDAEVLIVEGLTSLHPHLRPKFDYRIWVDTSPATAKHRGQARDAGNENEGKWDAWSRNDKMYLETYRPDQIADAIVSNE